MFSFKKLMSARLGSIATPAPTRRSRYHPQLELLEDRIVLSSTEGTILVINEGKSPWKPDDQQGAVGIFAVNRATGEQTPVSTRGLFATPANFCEGSAPEDYLYVADVTAFPSVEVDSVKVDSNGLPLPLAMGAIFAVDRYTGQQRVVAQATVLGSDGQYHVDPNSYINGPNCIMYMNGFLYVANEWYSDGTVHNIDRVDPRTGEQRLITDGCGGGFSVPVGTARASLFGGTEIYVADEPGNVSGSDLGKVWRVNVVTGQQTLIADGGLINHPVDLAMEASGNLVVANTGCASNGYTGSLIRINAQTGVQTVITRFVSDSGINSLAIDGDGKILVGAVGVASVPGRIYWVDSVTGKQRILTEGGLLSEVGGIAVFHVNGGDEDFPLSDSLVQVENADLTPVHTDSAFGVVDVVQTAQELPSETLPVQAAERPVSAAKNAADTVFASWPEARLGDLPGALPTRL